jgi:hypothetical protein
LSYRITSLLTAVADIDCSSYTFLF